MIKIKSKDKLNINYFLIISLVILAILLIRYIIVTRNYVSVEATVTQITIDTSSDGGTNANANSTLSYVTYIYQVEGEEYTANQQVLFTSGYKTGMQKKIKYNPDNPAEIFNVLLVKTYVSIMVFLVLFMLGVSKSKKISRNK